MLAASAAARHLHHEQHPDDDFCFIRLPAHSVLTVVHYNGLLASSGHYAASVQNFFKLKSKATKHRAAHEENCLL